MDQIYPDEGLIDSLHNTIGPGLVFHLFVNDIDPTLDTTITDLVEATWTGYVPITRLPTDFTFELLGNHVAQITADFCKFANTSGMDQESYGFYACFLGSENLFTCARFDGAPLVVHDGQRQQVLPGIANFSGLSS